MLDTTGLQHRLLDAYHTTMKETVRGIKLAAILITIQNLQLILLMFVSEESQVHQLTQSVSWLMNSLSIAMVVRNNQAAENLFLVVAAALILVVIAAHAICILKPSSARMLRYMGEIFQYVLAVPMISSLVMVLFNNLKDFNIVKALAASVILLIVVLYYILLELILVVFDLNSQDAMCRNPKSRYYLKVVLLCLISVAFVIDQHNLFEKTFDLLVCCLLAYYLICLYDKVVDMVDHSSSLARYRMCVLLLLMSFVIWDGIALNINIDLVRQNFISITLVFYGFVVVLMLNYRNYTIKKLLAQPIENIHNANEFHIKLRANYELLLDCKKDESNMLRSAVIKAHMADCTNAMCLCRCRQQLYDPTTREWSSQSVAPHNDPTYCKFFIKMLLEEGRTKFRESRLIEMTWLYLKWNLLRLYQQLFHEIKHYASMFERQINLGDRYLLHHLSMSIHDYLEARNINNTIHLKIEDIEKFDNCYEKLKNSICDIVETHEFFWKTMVETVVDRPSLLRVSDQLSNSKISIQQLYQETIQYNSNSVGLLAAMYFYSFKVVFDIKLAKRVRKDITIESSNERESNFEFPQQFRGDNQTATLKVSVQENDSSRIMWVSNQFEALFGYTKKDVVGEALSKIMPDIYATRHDSWMREWMERGCQIGMNKIRHVFVMTKQRSMCCCTIFIKVIPRMDHFDLIGMFRKNSDKNYTILNQQTGRVEASGSCLTEQILGIGSDAFDKEPTEVQIFSPELLQIFDQHDKLLQKNFSVHFLVPRNIKTYIESFSTEKHFIEARNSRSVSKEPPAPRLSGEKPHLRYQMYDLVTDSDSLHRIMYANIRLQRVEHRIAKEKLSFLIMKIVEVTQINEVPAALRTLQQQVKQDTYRRLESLKEFRKNRQQHAIDIFSKIYSDKKHDSQSASRQSNCSVRRNVINPATRTSMLRDNNSYKQQDKKRVKVGEQSPRRVTIQRIITKVKDALYKADIIGRSRFSYFFNRKRNTTPRASILTGAGSKQFSTRELGTIQKTSDFDSFYMHKDRNDSETFKDVEDKLDIGSGVSAKTDATTDMNYEQLRKRQASKQQHSSLRKYKLGLIVGCFLYLVTRIVSLKVLAAAQPQLDKSLMAYAEAAQVMMLTQLNYNSVLLMLVDQRDLASANMDSIEATSGSANGVLSTVLQMHLTSNAQSMLGHAYNRYLFVPSYMKMRPQHTEDGDVLKFIRTTQVETFDGIHSQGEQVEAVHFLVNNYGEVRRIAAQLNNIYPADIRSLSQIVQVCYILHSVLHSLFYLIFLILTYKYLSISQNWIKECLDTMSSTSVEMANACLHYYRQLRSSNEPDRLGESAFHIDLEESISGRQNCRIPNTKGDLNVWYRYPLLLLVVLCSLNQISIIFGYNNTEYLTSTSSTINLMYKGFSSLSQSYIKVKADMLEGDVNITSFYEIFPKDYTYFTNFTQLAFSRLEGTNFSNELLDILRTDVCQHYSQTPINVTYDKCKDDPITQFGITMQAQSLAVYLHQTYSKLVANPKQTKLLNMPHEFGLYYFYNGWTAAWDILHQDLHQRVDFALQVNLYIELVGLVLFAGLSVLSLCVYSLSVRRVNRISAYLLIIPRKLIQDNQYAKRYLRRFL